MRWCGKIGYEVMTETAVDVWTPTIVERTYYGDVDRTIGHIQNGESINDNLQLNMQVRIVADAFAFEHFSQIRYAEVFNSKWKVTSVEVNRPRITLNFGGVYTEEVEVSEQTSSTE